MNNNSSSLKISDYFKKDKINLEPEDWKEIQKIRTKINSFKDEYDQEKWIFNRRQSNFNRSEDFRLFGIPEDAEIGTDWLHKDNEYYNGKGKDEDQSNDKLDNFKRDKDGNLIYNKDGSIKQVGKLKRGANNFANNVKNSKVAKIAKFIAQHFYEILIALLVVLALIVLVNLIYFIGGTIGSMGRTPFILCGDDEINGKTNWNIEKQRIIADMSTHEYATQFFAIKAKEKGWKDNATIGAIMFILGEDMSGMGSFSYDDYHMLEGPKKGYYDVTLDNKLWLNWLDNEAKAYAEKRHSANDTYDISIRIGMFGLSDQWDEKGKKIKKDATDLINWCESKGKYWQDPSAQIEYYLNVKFNESSKPFGKETNQISDNRSPEEWCARLVTTLKFPELSWGEYDSKNNAVINDDDKIQLYMQYLDQALNLKNNAQIIDSSSALYKTPNLCLGANSIITGGNGSIADAAVSLASGPNITDKILFDSEGVDSKNLNDERLKTYKEMHLLYLPDDTLFASCDRAACTAIRWCGADPNFPIGGTPAQYNYLEESDLWSLVGTYSENLAIQPGDVIITKGGGHIAIYVGNEAVRKRFPNSDADTYCASYYEFFPMVYKRGSDLDSTYVVYRCNNTNNNFTTENNSSN